MALLPAVSGIIASTFDWRRLWLILAWLLCYCAQFTTARWLRARFRRRYLPPVAAYTAALALIGTPLLAMHPQLLIWAPWYATCAAVSLAGAWLRKDRSLWVNAASVLATSAMAMVVYTFDRPMSSHLLLSGATLAGVFACTQYGSVLYVKTMIRERRNPKYLAASWIWHIVLVILSARSSAVMPFTILSAALLVRAIVMPVVGRRAHIKPIIVGLGEMMFSLLICLVAPYCTV